MSLFGLADIVFNKNSSSPSGPLAKLETSSFFGSTLRYPLDLGNYDKGHYVAFYIREQIKSKFAAKVTDAPADSSINTFQVPTTGSIIPKTNVQGMASQYAGQITQKIDSTIASVTGSIGGSTSTQDFIGGAKNVVNSGLQSLGGLIDQSWAAQAPSADTATTNELLSNNMITKSNSSYLRTTQLTKDVIALYMPDTLMYNYEQGYSDLNIGNSITGKLMAGVESAIEAYQKDGSKGAGSSLAKTVGMTAGDIVSGKFGDAGKVAFTAATGTVANPMLELIYSSPKFREFQFDFSFYPRDEKEALEVQKILQKLRFHQAPEFAQDTKGFLIPPSEFDIRFYYGGTQNPNIDTIGTCVLKNIQINYAPNGWAAYEVPTNPTAALGATGMPVAVQVSLTFMETSYFTKDDYVTGR